MATEDSRRPNLWEKSGEWMIAATIIGVPIGLFFANRLGTVGIECLFGVMFWSGVGMIYYGGEKR